MSPSTPFSLSVGSMFFQDKAKESMTGSARTSVSLVTISSVVDSAGFGAGVSVGSTVGSTIGDGCAVSISVSGVRIGLIFVVNMIRMKSWFVHKPNKQMEVPQ